jgi:hypothetical protein
MKKKIIIIGYICLFGIVNSFAQNGTDREITWKIENGILIISGTGDMPTYMPVLNYPPWHPYVNSINAAVVELGITSIGNFAFYSCFRLTSINISNSVTRIGRNAFTDSGLQSVVVPYGVTTLDNSAFSQCALSYITLPSSITTIRDYVFVDCPLISIINLNPVPLAINANVFDGVNIKDCTLKVPIGAVAAYKSAPVWKEFNIVGINVGIEDMEEPEPGILIYPNPTTGACTITIPENFMYESSLILSIYDVSGKLLQQISIDNGTENFNLKLEHRAAGIYPVVLSNGKKSYRGKIVFN